MRKILEPTVGRTDRAWGWASGFKGLKTVISVILFLALPHNPVQAVTLGWDSSPDPTVVGYNVYNGVASGTYTNVVDVGNATSISISGLVDGTTYYFAVTAYNSFGLESDFSGEISYLVPIAPITLARLEIRIAPAGQAVLTVTGQTGHTHDIQATEDLTVWTSIGRVTLGASGSIDITDTNAASFSQRFYRTREAQP
jgi:hypothetical protein